jgi:C4-dicarboxylate-specific signal transduction histidine kinase
MSRTIDDFRNFFRPEKEKMLFEVRQVVTRTLTLIEGNFSANQITVEVVADDDPVVIGYPNEYSQVLLNILSNAVDAFQEQSSDNPHIVVKVFTENDKAVVTIMDNAGGIREDIIGRIFEPYFTTKEQGKGTGVGLYMAKNIIENSMNGSLTVRNAGQGAEFRIEV